MDIIHLLPDSVANQIAAGEVIQRPASVVKELVENAIDAGAQNIQVVIKEGGGALIQIIDDGGGMSETDARMAFERHATSKITNASDLFSLHTFGFRGEALASVASVAQVQLKTRKKEDELGTFIEIAGSNISRQESVHCDKGTNIAVKNLFFNVPARRRFLKSNSTEMTHVRNEFYRIALVHPEVNFSLHENDIEVMQLPATTLKARIEHVFHNTGKRKLEHQLLPIHTNTSLLNIKGFVGRPEFSQKTANQYFFVNGRYMRHPYFHKAVMTAYSQLIKQDENPNYFIYFEIDPQSIDINVHPSKTEIKFENEQAIWSILLTAIKESLGKFQVTPALDFDNEDMPDIPVFDRNVQVSPPKTNFNPEYNPFKSTAQSSKPVMNWEDLYRDFSKSTQIETTPETETLFPVDTKEKMKIAENQVDFFQYKSKYIITSVKSGLMFIDQHRAHSRVLFEVFMNKIRRQKGFSQQALFPEIVELNMEDSLVLEKILEDLRYVGFDIEPFGKHSFSVNGTPAETHLGLVLPIIQELISQFKETEIDVKETVHEKIALALASKTAVKSGQELTVKEMEELVGNLFACENHQYTSDGKLIVSLIQNDEIEKKFR